MRAVKAKILRGKLGFKPSAPREYDMGRQHQKIVMGADRKPQMSLEGKPQLYAVTGTVTCKGARGQYQKVKRNQVLTAAVLRAGMAGGL